MTRSGYICRWCFDTVETEVTTPTRACNPLFCSGIMDGVADIDDPNYQGEFGREPPGTISMINSTGGLVRGGNIGTVRNINSRNTRVVGTHFFGHTAVENYAASTIDVRSTTHDPHPDLAPPPMNRAQRREQKKRQRSERGSSTG